MKKTILDYLDSTAKKFSEKIAFCDSDGRAITFQNLKSDVEIIGSYIIKNHNEKNRPIVVFTERNIKSIPAFLGVTYSGNFYIPVDATLPIDRINAMLNLANPLFAINCSDFEYDIKNYKVVTFDEIKESKTQIVERNNVIDISPLYGIFTSGSTGFPKLVIKNHMSLISFIDEYTQKFNFSPDDIQGNQIPFYFDASTKDLFTTLKVGCTTNIINKSYFSQPGKLAEYLENNNITSICWVPSALSMLSMFNVFSKYKFEKIKRVLFVGEAMHTKQLNIWVRALPWADFINLYGSTENAGNCLCHVINKEIDENERVPIGKAFENVEVFLLDDNDKLIEPSNCTELGEICVSGDTLALGYYKDFETNAKKFCQNPLNPYYYERIFRTGDIAKYNEQGDIVYICRKDCQIKLNGYRIELCDIDVCAMNLDGIKSACSIYDEARKKIILFYSANTEMQTELMTHLKEKLPTYMIPTKYIYFEDMPLNANGKVHRTKLKEIYEQMTNK